MAANFSGFQNGLAIGGDYMSAASFLGISGCHRALRLRRLPLLHRLPGGLAGRAAAGRRAAAQHRPVHHGRRAGFRMRQRRSAPPRRSPPSWCRSSTCSPRWSAPAELVGLLLGITTQAAKNLVIVGVGLLMIIYVVFGGMKGTTWVQIVKAVMLMTGARDHDDLGAGQVRLQPVRRCSARPPTTRARARRSWSRACATAWNATTKALLSKLDFISLALALVLGTAGLPHILIRFYTVPDRQAARKSVLWAIGLIGIFYLMTLALGFGAAALVDTARR